MDCRRSRQKYLFLAPTAKRPDLVMEQMAKRTLNIAFNDVLSTKGKATVERVAGIRSRGYG